MEEEGVYIDGVWYPYLDPPELDENGVIIIDDSFFDPDATDTKIMNPNPNKLKETFKGWSFTNKILSMGVLWIVLSTKAWK